NTGQQNATFIVRLSSASGQRVSVRYATLLTPGSATADVDYKSMSGTLTWEVGDTTTRTITVPVLGDTLPEAAETFFVVLSGAQAATISRAQATDTILDDDLRPDIAITSARRLNRSDG